MCLKGKKNINVNKQNLKYYLNKSNCIEGSGYTRSGGCNSVKIVLPSFRKGSVVKGKNLLSMEANVFFFF